MTSVETLAATSTQQRLERLVVTASALIAEVSMEGVLKQVVRSAAELIGAHYAAVGVLAPDGRLLESFTTYGIDDELRAKIGEPPRGHGILGLVIREARPVRLPDLTRHPDSYGFPPHHPPMHSFLGVPIVGRRGVFGNLYLTEKVGGALFTEEDEHIAVLLANSVAAVVENARLHEESARLLEEVQQLHRTRERFFAMVNHELRNALAAVLRLGRDAGAQEGPQHRAAGGIRGARFGPAGDRADQRPPRPEPAGRGPAQAGDPVDRARQRGEACGRPDDAGGPSAHG